MSPSLCFNSPAPTEISTLSLHDALPIFHGNGVRVLTWLEGRSEETHARAARAWVSSLRPSSQVRTRTPLPWKIGRASCRERVEISVGAGELKQREGDIGRS